MALYQRLLADHPRYCHFPRASRARDRACADEVLFYLAYEHEQAAEDEAALRTYRQLTRNWPQSRYRRHSYLALGELYFEQAQRDARIWQSALAAYERVTQAPPPHDQLWGYAHYKLGHVQWNLWPGDRSLAPAYLSGSGPQNEGFVNAWYIYFWGEKAE